MVMAVAFEAAGCAGAMPRVGAPASGTDSMVMPDLFRMTKANAIAALERGGFAGEIAWDDQLCGSVVDGQIVELGEVCRQEPPAGRQVSTRQRVKILVQPEDPRHGHVGEFGEWHLMPQVVGLPVDRAKAAMLEAGFTDGRNRIDYVVEPTCPVMQVCRSYPAAFERVGQGSDRVLTVGASPPSAGDGGDGGDPGASPPAETSGSYF